MPNLQGIIANYSVIDVQNSIELFLLFIFTTIAFAYFTTKHIRLILVNVITDIILFCVILISPIVVLKIFGISIHARLQIMTSIAMLTKVLLNFRLIQLYIHERKKKIPDIDNVTRPFIISLVNTFTILTAILLIPITLVNNVSTFVNISILSAITLTFLIYYYLSRAILYDQDHTK